MVLSTMTAARRYISVIGNEEAAMSTALPLLMKSSVQYLTNTGSRVMNASFKMVLMTLFIFIIGSL